MKTTCAIKAIELEAKFKKAARSVKLGGEQCWEIVDLHVEWNLNPMLGCREISKRLDKILGE